MWQVKALYGCDKSRHCVDVTSQGIVWMWQVKALLDVTSQGIVWMWQVKGLYGCDKPRDCMDVTSQGIVWMWQVKALYGCDKSRHCVDVTSQGTLCGFDKSRHIVVIHQKFIRRFINIILLLISYKGRYEFCENDCCEFEKKATTQVQDICLSADTIIILIFQQGVLFTDTKWLKLHSNKRRPIYHNI